MKDSGDEIKHRGTAALLALTIHGLLFLLLYFFVIKTPIPPFPESGSSGLEVNFGISETGSGDQQTSYSEEEVSSTESPAQATQETEEEPVVTADNGEDTPIQEPKKKKPKKKKEQPESKQTQSQSTVASSNNTTQVNKEVKQVEPEPPKAMALYGGKKKSSKGADGKKGGDGEGSGDGQGSGSGSGNGAGAGKPVSFSLTGRKASNLPVPRDRFDEAGRVVVEIFVNQQGIVKRAKAGVKGSTTSNPNLLEIARKAALSSVFSVSEDAPEEQRGTIIYNFILN
jgi:outer membrane biosynthesis protein TonB